MVILPLAPIPFGMLLTVSQEVKLIVRDILANRDEEIACGLFSCFQICEQSQQKHAEHNYFEIKLTEQVECVSMALI